MIPDKTLGLLQRIQIYNSTNRTEEEVCGNCSYCKPVVIDEYVSHHSHFCDYDGHYMSKWEEACIEFEPL
jgi:hypothetical protein